MISYEEISYEEQIKTPNDFFIIFLMIYTVVTLVSISINTDKSNLVTMFAGPLACWVTSWCITDILIMTRVLK